MSTSTLRSIAWNHSRGFTSVVATAQRFEEMNPEVSIRWEKRSLQAFADASLADLAEQFDLIVMDHPHTALAATEGLLLPMEEWLDATFLADQAANSVGASHESYQFGGKQWTLATDAAAPIATWRPDLMERYKISLPETWEQVLELARAGYVSCSAYPIDVLMHSYMFCKALGNPPFTRREELAPTDILTKAFEELRLLTSLCDPCCLESNPIRIAEPMTTTDDSQRAAYSPFAYGYSNYSRPGYARHVLKAGGLVTLGGERLCSTLGGAGLAVSSKSKYPSIGMDYVAFTASPEVQRGLYFHAGGQLGHRSAWSDKLVNAASSNFFHDTLSTLDEAIVRPQFPGYMAFHDAATPVAHDCVSGKISPKETAVALNRLYQHVQQ